MTGQVEVFASGEPAPIDGAQRRFWALFGREAEALQARDEAEGAVARRRDPIARAVAAEEAEAQLAAARADLDAFLRAHRGRSFRVFRPEEIAAAFREDITPLDL